MRYFKIIYEKKDVRETWIEVPEEEIVKESLDEFAGEHVAAREFWADFKRYDDESDECDNDNGTNILEVTEIDKNGDEI